MDQMTEVQKLEHRLFGDENKKLRNVRFDIDKRKFAETYGGQFIEDPDFPSPFGGTIDWTNSPYTSEQRQEFLAQEINRFMDAAEDPKRSHRLSSSTDKWGNLLDKKHFDYMTLEERIEHVKLSRRMNSNSRFEYEAVIDGHLPPAEGRTVQDYKDEWEIKKANSLRGGREHPYVDPQDVFDDTE